MKKSANATTTRRSGSTTWIAATSTRCRATIRAPSLTLIRQSASKRRWPTPTTRGGYPMPRMATKSGHRKTIAKLYSSIPIIPRHAENSRASLSNEVIRSPPIHPSYARRGLKSADPGHPVMRPWYAARRFPRCRGPSG